MTIKIADIAALQEEVIDGENLRFVVSKRAWYLSSQLGTDTADGDNIVAPSSGTGRWYKNKAATTDAEPIQVEVQSSGADFTSSANTHYIVDLTSASGLISTTLPNSAVAGDRVKYTISSIQNLPKRLVIQRGTGTIARVALNLQLVLLSHSVELVFDGVSDWVATGDIILYSPAEVFPAPALTTSPQNGILKYLGEDYGNVTFSNPAYSGTVSPTIKVKFTSAVLSPADNGMRMSNRLATAASSPSNSFYSEQAIGVNFYDYSSNLPILVRLSHVYIHWSTLFPEFFSIKSTTTMSPISDSVYMYAPNTGTGSMMDFNSGYRGKVLPNWKTIAAIDNQASLMTLPSYGATAGHNARIYEINDSDFCSYYLIQPYSAGGVTSNSSYGIFQIEFYGEVINPNI